MQNKKNVAVYTADSFLYQKIRLALHDRAEVLFCEGKDFCDLCLVDIDSSDISSEGFVSMSRVEKADIKIPFSLDSVASFLNKTENSRPPLWLSKSERAAYLRGEKIKLTELEFSLLERLALARGEFVSKDDILKSVWNGDFDSGIINVYIHYLREKLEKYGEKIILSSRKCGYKIEEKYLGGENFA